MLVELLRDQKKFLLHGLNLLIDILVMRELINREVSAWL
jgi:hypothetical protein